MSDARKSQSNEWPNVERRASNRPSLGDRLACPSCGATMRFYEHHAVAKGEALTIEPAWVCRCGYEEYVRRR